MHTRHVVFLIVGVVFLVSAAGCGDEEDRANLPPSVTLRSGPFEGDTVSYQINIAWSGDDPDGHVVRYEVTTDPPIAFSEEEIASGGPGITETRIPGAGGAPDTTRVSKSDGAQVVSFDWVHTTALEQAFRFSTEEPESVLSTGSGTEPTGRFLGLHAVYVRAVDDDEAPSVPAHVAFTASTVAPSAEITYPHIERDLLNLGTRVNVAWTGSDPDGPAPDAKPVGYYYKLLNLTALGINCASVIDPDVLYEYTNEGDPGWVYVDADSAERVFLLPYPKCYLIGVRAVDEAGAVEPFLEYGRNVFKFRTVPVAGYPLLFIQDASLGSFTVRYPFEPVNRPGGALQAAAGRPIQFFWSASAEAYGGEIEAYSWGVDLPDVDVEGPGSGWSAWGEITSTPPITFRNPSLHVFYIRVRDTVGTINIAEIPVQFVAITLDQDMLYVDDYPDRTYPRPEEHDAFWMEMFDNADGRFLPGEVAQWDVFGPDDTGPAPLVPSLERLGRYRMLLWTVNGGGYNGLSGLLETSSKSLVLSTYLRAGGTLWVNGVYTVPAMSSPLNSGIADFAYPKTTLGTGDFIWDFMKVQTGRIDNDKEVNNDNRFVRAIPADSILTQLPHIYDAMHVDGATFSPRTPNKSVAYVDAVIDPIFAEATPGFRGDVDTLYLYGTQARLNGRRSAYDYRICALRWHDPDPAREHGRVQWFGFPMYYFKTDQAQDTFNKSVDWFRED